MQFSFRTIKLVKDFIQSTRSEAGLQRILLAVDVMREARGNFKASNFTNIGLINAINSILAFDD